MLAMNLGSQHKKILNTVCLPTNHNRSRTRAPMGGADSSGDMGGNMGGGHSAAVIEMPDQVMMMDAEQQKRK